MHFTTIETKHIRFTIIFARLGDPMNIYQKTPDSHKSEILH